MKRSYLITGIVIGTILALGPLWGMLGTMFGMMHAFTVLGGNGVSDPRALSDSIGVTLFATVAGVIACPIGLALLVTCIVRLVRQRKQPPLVPPAPVSAGSQP